VPQGSRSFRLRAAIQRHAQQSGEPRCRRLTAQTPQHSPRAAAPRRRLSQPVRRGVKIGFDLACTTQNCVAFSNERRIPCDESGNYDPEGKHWIGGRTAHGYFFDQGVNALEQDWNTIAQDVAFLNPEFNHIEPWVLKLWLTAVKRGKTGTGPRIFSLLPAGVSTDWFACYVAGKCNVSYVRPRIGFIDPETQEPIKCWNEKKQMWVPQGINRDCMLLDWNYDPNDVVPFKFSSDCWNYKTGEIIQVA
jgi:hypothetical protein